MIGNIFKLIGQTIVLGIMIFAIGYNGMLILKYITGAEITATQGYVGVITYILAFMGNKFER